MYVVKGCCIMFESRFKPIRFRPARPDATVGKIEETIEEMFDLPDGCVQINNPDNNKNSRSDQYIKNLRNRAK